MKKFFTPFRIILILVMLLAIGTAVFCLTQVDWSDTGDNLDAGGSGGNSNAAYNEAATNAGLTGNKLGKNEILIAHETETHSNKNITVTFRVYAVAEGQDPKSFLGLTAQEAEENPALTRVGTATAIFMGGNAKNIRDLTISHDM